MSPTVLYDDRGAPLFKCFCDPRRKKTDQCRAVENDELVVHFQPVVSLREACRQAAGWRAADRAAHNVWLSVNLSPQQVMPAGLVDTIRAVLGETGFPPTT